MDNLLLILDPAAVVQLFGAAEQQSSRMAFLQDDLTRGQALGKLPKSTEEHSALAETHTEPCAETHTQLPDRPPLESFGPFFEEA
ncbi:hypothetical protein AOLI_G00298070 [Acnodon oligacanthus]